MKSGSVSKKWHIALREWKSIKHNRQILSGHFLIFIPVIELDTSLRVRVGLALSEGRVLEAVSLHPVELIVDIADQTGVVLVKWNILLYRQNGIIENSLIKRKQNLLRRLKSHNKDEFYFFWSYDLICISFITTRKKRVNLLMLMYAVLPCLCWGNKTRMSYSFFEVLEWFNWLIWS